LKYLIVGLGNPGTEYQHTRHNIGFDIVDALAAKHGAVFSVQKMAEHTTYNFKGRQVHLIKPITFINLSGKALRYWMQELQIPLANILVLVDDLAIDFGKIRIKPSGSDAGHNGLKNIFECLQTKDYARLRFGIGSNFHKGKQVEYVLGKWNPNEAAELPLLIESAVNACDSFVFRGLAMTMNEFSKK
jgi:PTH1 family peptidyl-tRNA hydrolase